jgi:hypothetical protein
MRSSQHCCSSAAQLNFFPPEPPRYRIEPARPTLHHTGGAAVQVDYADPNEGPAQSQSEGRAPKCHDPRAAGGGSSPHSERAPLHYEPRSGCLAERGVQAELDAKENLQTTYKLFMNEQEPSSKNQAGKDLVRAIFGKDALATEDLCLEDTVL